MAKVSSKSNFQSSIMHGPFFAKKGAVCDLIHNFYLRKTDICTSMVTCCTMQHIYPKQIIVCWLLSLTTLQKHTEHNNNVTIFRPTTLTSWTCNYLIFSRSRKSFQVNPITFQWKWRWVEREKKKLVQFVHSFLCVCLSMQNKQVQYLFNWIRN